MEQPQAEQSQPDFKNMTRGQLVDLIYRTSVKDIRGALQIAVKAAEQQGTDDAYETAVSFANAAAVTVPGTKTIWTERRLREYLDKGIQRPGS